MNMSQKIPQKSHERHYLLHRYWGRKSAGLISHYLNKYTKEGDLVVDPFMGSGVTLIESMKINRNVIGYDVNPLSKLIVDTTVNPINPQLIIDEYNRIFESIPSEIHELYKYNNSIIQSRLWKNGHIEKIRVGDANLKSSTIVDKKIEIKEKTEILNKLFNKYKSDIYIPEDKILKYVRRSGKDYIKDLFSKTNLLSLGLINKKVKEIKNKELRNACLLIFSSSLANSSLMIPADEIKVRGKSGWQISKIWVPKISIEKNPFISINKKILDYSKSCEEIKDTFKNNNYQINIKTSKKITLDDNSVDYILTDPPYGDSIAYLGLNMFWNSWVSKSVKYDDEIIYDTYRKKTVEVYQKDMDVVYAECFRILKPKSHFTFTFNNRHLIFWKIIIDAALKAGFEIKDVVWVDQAVNSGTQGINKKNTLKGDFVYTFIKPANVINETLVDIDGVDLILNKVEHLLEKNNFIEVNDLYKKLIPVIIKKRVFLDNGNLINIEKLLFDNFKLLEKEINNEKKYGWSKK